MTDVQPAFHPSERISVLGIPIDRLTMEEAMERLEAQIASRTPGLVVTADASGLVIAGDDPEFQKILLSATLVTPDSAGVLWAMRRKGVATLGRVSGVDLVDRLCAKSMEKGYRIFLLGAAPGIAELAAEKLQLRYPGCRIVGTRNGYFPASDDALVAQEIAALKPDVLFVAMGMPRQEKFIVGTMDIIRAPVAMGVGGSLDVFSGKVRRAPKWMQRLQLEWLWRLIKNPRKIGKVMALPKFVWRVLRSKG